MKKVFFIIPVLLGFCLLISATYVSDIFDFLNKNPEKRAQKLTEVMTEKLVLNDLQVKKVKAINLKYALKMQPILESDQDLLGKWMEAQPLNFKRGADIKLILNESQLEIVTHKKAKIKPLLENLLSQL